MNRQSPAQPKTSGDLAREAAEADRARDIRESADVPLNGEGSRWKAGLVRTGDDYVISVTYAGSVVEYWTWTRGELSLWRLKAPLANPQETKLHRALPSHVIKALPVSVVRLLGGDEALLHRMTGR